MTHRSHLPNAISIGSSVSAQLVDVDYYQQKQTDRDHATSVTISLNSIRSNLLKTCLKPDYRPRFRHVCEVSQTQTQTDTDTGPWLVPRMQKISRTFLPKNSATYRSSRLRPGHRLFLSKTGFEQDRSNGIWKRQTHRLISEQPIEMQLRTTLNDVIATYL